MSIIKKLKRWFRINVLKRVTVLDILEYVDTHRSRGLCYSIIDAFNYYHIDGGFARSIDYFKLKCTEFNINAAMKYGARSDCWWWAPDVWTTGREAFLHYLIDYYASREPIYFRNEQL